METREVKIIVSGKSGTGKSTISSRIAEKIRHSVSA